MFVNASEVSSIDMNIYVDNYGTAYVEEIWDAYVNEGTEGWHPYYNLGVSDISDLKVSIDGMDYSIISNWDVNADFNDKAYKAGIYMVNDEEVDICFGITDYGNHIYNIKYKISNFVATVDDADIIYWNLFPKNFSVEPKNVNIKIYSDFKYEDTLDVWGYGKYGAPCYVYDGSIEMTSDGVIASDEYLTILVKFPKDTFQVNNILENDFDYYYDMASNGAVNYLDKTSFLDEILDVFMLFFNFFIWLFIIVVLGIFSRKNYLKNNNMKFGETGNKVRKDVPNFREIPCNKDIFRAYWVATNYKLLKKKEDFLGAILLKWLSEDIIKIEKLEKDGLFKDKVKNNIIFVNRPTAIEVETKLYDYMFQASCDGKLENNEFKKWCSNNYSKIFEWFDEVIKYETDLLVNENKITEEMVTGIFSRTVYHVDSSMMVEAEQMAGLKKFLKEFTLIKKREPIEIKLWNEYLIYAQMFGIADAVAKQFKELYPEIIEDMEQFGYDYSDFLFVYSITNNGIKSASLAKSRAESYSSGGGGFSSGGGGGGSFGGGAGGGGFR